MKNKNVYIIIFLSFFLFAMCSNNTKNDIEKQREIEKILHDNQNTYWDVYTTEFKSTDFGNSYEFKKNGVCYYKAEIIMSPTSKNNVTDDEVDATFNVIVNGDAIYLRLALDLYKVLNYNDEYFKLLGVKKIRTNEYDTIYLHKSPCQTEDCYIPETIKPAPF